MHELADLIGADALTPTDRTYLTFEDAFATELVNQRFDESRSLTDTLDRASRVVFRLPRSELSMLPAELLERHPPDEH